MTLSLADPAFVTLSANQGFTTFDDPPDHYWPWGTSLLSVVPDVGIVGGNQLNISGGGYSIVNDSDAGHVMEFASSVAGTITSQNVLATVGTSPSLTVWVKFLTPLDVTSNMLFHVEAFKFRPCVVGFNSTEFGVGDLSGPAASQIHYLADGWQLLAFVLRSDIGYFVYSVNAQAFVTITQGVGTVENPEQLGVGWSPWGVPKMRRCRLTAPAFWGHRLTIDQLTEIYERGPQTPLIMP